VTPAEKGSVLVSKRSVRFLLFASTERTAAGPITHSQGRRPSLPPRTQACERHCALRPNACTHLRGADSQAGSGVRAPPPPTAAVARENTPQYFGNFAISRVKSGRRAAGSGVEDRGLRLTVCLWYKR
jgi:hypothetical protein